MTRSNPENMRPPVSPHLIVDGAKKAIEFYTEAFGATELFRLDAEDGKRLMHASLDINGGLVMLCDSFPEMPGAPAAPETDRPGPIAIHLYVDDVDKAMKRASEAGAEVLMPAQDMFWGERYGKLQDPFGHRWSLSTPLPQSSSA